MSENPPTNLSTAMRTTSFRTRLTVATLWDGRCGHCRAPLVSSCAGITVDCSPLEVDHAIPRSRGGTDTVWNYIASCHDCNWRRSARPLTAKSDGPLIAALWQVRQRLMAESEEQQAWQRPQVDLAFVDRTHVSATRCADHEWHVDGSVDALHCRARTATRLIRANFRGSGREWWSRFGLESMAVLHTLDRHAQARSWNADQRHHMLWHLPRYAHTPADVVRVLRGSELPDDVRRLDPAPSLNLDFELQLMPSGRGRARAASIRALANDTADNLRDFGIQWPGLVHLWAQKQWPTLLLHDHHVRIAVAQSGRRQPHIAAMRLMTDIREVEAYLTSIDRIE